MTASPFFETILKLDCTTSTFTQKISHNLKHGLKFPERIHANKRKTRCDFDNAFSIMAPSGKTATTSNAGRILEDLGQFWIRFAGAFLNRGWSGPIIGPNDPVESGVYRHSRLHQRLANLKL